MKTVKCITINVDCCHNDPVDVRCGGPEYLGFDFYVKRHEEQEMIRYIITSLEELHVPLMSIRLGDPIELAEEHVWTKERILKSIVKSADEIKNEATRYYNEDVRHHI